MDTAGWNKLTEGQKELLRFIVERVRSSEMPDEFMVIWSVDCPHVFWPGLTGFLKGEGITAAKLDALTEAGLIQCRPKFEATQTQFSTIQREMSRDIALTALAYEAVDTNFAAPDTSYVRHLTPLADVEKLDPELQERCLPILGAGASNRKLWDSAVRTAGVVLEERLRAVAGVSNQCIGRELVNKAFGKNGTLAALFSDESEREGYRDLFAGVVGVLRNPSAHRLTDPAPHEGGAWIVFVNLLLHQLQRFVRPPEK
jgi:hypothetical protein